MKKIMKRIMQLISICVIFNTLCVARVEALAPPNDLKHHSEKDFNALQKWINNPDEDKEGFEELIKCWKGFKGFSIPVYCGSEADKVFVDSNVDIVSFHFSNPGVNIYAERGLNLDYEESAYTGSKVCVDMMDKQREGKLYAEYGEDNNYYSLSIVENGLCFQFSYYSKKDFDASMFKGFSFKQIKKDLVQPVVCKFAKKRFVIKKGKKKTLKIKISGPEKYSFKINKKKVVKIDNTNSKFVKIKALKKGKVTITAKAGNKKSKCKVVVK